MVQIISINDYLIDKLSVYLPSLITTTLAAKELQSVVSICFNCDF